MMLRSTRVPSSTASDFLSWMGFGLVILVLSILAGLLAASGSFFLVGGFAALIVGTVLLFSPNLLFSVAMIFALVVGGLAEFYLHIAQANWIASGLAAALWGTAILACFSKSSAPPVRKSSIPAIGLLVGMYIATLLLTSGFNLISFTQLTVGMRNYFPFIGVFIVIRYAISRQMVDRIPEALVWIGLLQLPFCLHQFVFIGARRNASTSAMGGAAEALNGTFGGDMFSFGLSGSMAVFVLIASCIALALNNGVRGKWLAWAMVLAALACVGMAETKIFFVLTPLVLTMVFWEDIKASPRKLFGLVAGMMVVLGVLAAIYAQRFWVGGFADFWHAFTYSFDPDFMVTTQYRGRIGTLVHWWEMNVLSLDVFHSMLGYGVASTLENSRVLGVGSAVLIFGVGLDQHAASKLLWDAGIVGFSLFVWIAVRTGLNAHRLVRYGHLPDPHRRMLKATRGAMLAFLMMIPYQVSVVGEAPTQALFWLFVGYVAYWRHQHLQNEVKA